MQHGGKQIYSFGEIQVNLFQRTVTCRGEDLHLRPRSFEVLVYLLQNRNRLVSKEELIENVWKVTAITDDALVKSIVEIRKAIGDDSRHSRFLKTVPKVGYRFISPVDEASVERIQIEKIRSVEIELEEEVNEFPSQDFPNVPIENAPFPGRQEKSRLWLLIPMLVLIAAISFYIGSTFFQSRESVPATTVPNVPGKRTVAVAFFDNLSGDEHLDWLREGLAEMLITGLSQSDQLTLLGRQQFHLLLQRIGHKETEEIRLSEALEIARRSKVQTVILGGFATVGNQIRIDAQVYDARNGQLIATDHLVVEKPEEILTNIDLLSLKIASSLGVSRREHGAIPAISDVMTNNLNAYRYYSLALVKAQGLQSKEAIDLLKKAIEIDSQFAMAHARIGYAYAVTWNLSDLAKPHLQKAFELSERLTTKDKLYITTWNAIANEDFSVAIESLQEIVKHYPFEIEAYSQLGRLLKGESRYPEALETYRQALIMDPEAADIYNGMGGLYSDLGRHKEAIHARQKYLQLAPDVPNAYDSLGLSYQAAGLYPQAMEQYNRALALNPDFEIAVVHLGNSFFQLGRYREAIREFERYVQIAPSDEERIRGIDSIANVYWKKGEVDLAEETLRRLGSSAAVITSILIAADRQDPVRVEALQKQFLQNPSSSRGSRLNSRIYYFPMAYSLLKKGNIAEAIEIFKKASVSPAPHWHYDSFEDSLANAYFAAGRIDDAISEYKRVLIVNPNYPLAHFSLAQAYEAKGSSDLANEEYEKFLQVWKNADRDLPQVKTALKRIDQFKKQI